MEALSSSALQIKSFSERSLAAKTSRNNFAFVRNSYSYNKIQSLRREVADGREDDSDNGAVRLVPEETLSLSLVRTKQKKSLHLYFLGLGISIIFYLLFF